ncbi:DUF4190 domain-containing protein [Agromyces sp. LHK192]|uniref:DUF4190 domain-containing protein n=1 Tax=Agromyces sp. LHK192 TaxID=2498704 RepID=UPI000FD77487|nr:DUF4190 domain-containing protein [Agromyces sp. LHK192]
MTDPAQPPVPPSGEPVPPAQPPVPPAPPAASVPPTAPSQPVPPAPPAPAGAPAANPDTFPGKTLGIVGLVLAILMPLIGLILSIVANSQSKKAGFKNGPAKAGIIVGAILLVIGVIVTVIVIIISIAAVGSLADICSELGPGVWDVDGVTYTCN